MGGESAGEFISAFMEELWMGGRKQATWNSTIIGCTSPGRRQGIGRVQFDDEDSLGEREDSKKAS